MLFRRAIILISASLVLLLKMLFREVKVGRGHVHRVKLLTQWEDRSVVDESLREILPLLDRPGL